MGLNQVLGMAGQAYGLAKDIFGINHKRDDKRQVEQQEKLSRQQAQIQHEAQMKMFDATNYDRQVEELKEAGLNPALLYGKGGGGGATVGGSISGGMAASAAATRGADTQGAGMAMQMGMQMQLMQAQKENIQADTELKKTDAEKKAGIDTELGKTQIESLTQGITNQKAVEALTRADTALRNISIIESNISRGDRMEYIEHQTGIALNQLEQAQNETFISGATINDKIKIIAQEAIYGGLKNELTEAQTKGVYKGMQVDDAQIRKMANDTAQKFIELNLQQRGQDITKQLGQGQQQIGLEQTAIQALKTQIDANYPGMWNVVGRSMEDFFTGLAEIMGAQRNMKIKRAK